MKDTTVQLEEGQRQMVLLALAKLAVERPGFQWALEQVALLMDDRDEGDKPRMFSAFLQQNQEVPFLIAPTAPLMVALDELVKLSNHYSKLLNAWDGGERRQFANGEAWITRLIQTGTFPSPKVKP